MKLTPYSSEEARHHKVLKHVFLSLKERWWELLDGLVTWQADHTTLRAARCLDNHGDTLRSRLDDTTREVLERNHSGWLHAAEQACNEGRNAQRVYPGKSPDEAVYIGNAGVQVVVAKNRFLVTCYRPGNHSSRVGDTERTRQADARAKRRAGVRRRTRYASYSRNDSPQNED